MPTAETNRSTADTRFYNSTGVILFCIFAAAMLCGFVWHGRALIIAGLIFSLWFVGFLLPILSVRNLSAQIFPIMLRGNVGQPLQVQVKMRNRNPWVWGTTVVELADHSGNQKYQHLIPRVRLVGTTDSMWKLVPQQRGVFPGDTITILSRFPFGVFTAKKRIKSGPRCIVWPEIVPIKAPASAARQAGYQMPVPSNQLLGSDGDISGPRPHRPGESLRRVHWRHTARQGELIVCDREATSSQRMRVRLDLDSSNKDEAASYEIAIAVAASLLSSAIDSQWTVDLDMVGSRVWEGIDKRGLPKTLDFLATFDQSEPSHTSSVATISRLKSARFVLVTNRQPESSNTFTKYDRVIFVDMAHTDPDHIHHVTRLVGSGNWRKQVSEIGGAIYGG